MGLAQLVCYERRAVRRTDKLAAGLQSGSIRGRGGQTSSRLTLQRGSMRGTKRTDKITLACSAEACGGRGERTDSRWLAAWKHAGARRTDKHGWLAARDTADKRQCAGSWQHLAVEQNGTAFLSLQPRILRRGFGCGAWGRVQSASFYVFGAWDGQARGVWFEACGPFQACVLRCVYHDPSRTVKL